MLLNWTFTQDAQDTIEYFSLKYFPLLFPKIVTTANTTNSTYQAIGLIPQATYLFELRPILRDTALQVLSTEVTLEKIRELILIDLFYFHFDYGYIHSSC